MIVRASILCILASTQLGLCDAVVPTRTIRAQTILTADMVSVDRGIEGHDVTNPKHVLGMEARVVLYAGRAIRADDLIQPALIHRNQLVPVIFDQHGLQITTMGRALDRGAIGEMIRVMNIESRNSVFGLVQSNGTVSVTNN